MAAVPPPVTTDRPPAAGPAPTPSRAGRNLPVAIAVGVGLGAVIVASLYTVRPAFVAVVAGAVGYGCYELATVLRSAAGRQLPLPPLLAGVAGSYAAGYVGGSSALLLGALCTAVAVVGWRALTATPGQRGRAMARDLSAGLWVVGYLVLLAGFAVLLAAPEDGARRTTCFIAVVVCSDVGGYATGVLFGRHPMAPSVSPKKSWEGFAGSVAACALGGALLLGLLLHTALWQGVCFGLATVATATVGDLAESLVKRDLGVKDMGRLLPGHGGVLDRLDSLLLTAPVAYLLLTTFAPPA